MTLSMTVNRHFMLDSRTFCLAIRDGDIDRHDPVIVPQDPPLTEYDWGDTFDIGNYPGQVTGYNKDFVATRAYINPSQEFLDRSAVCDYWDNTDLSMFDTLDFDTVSCTNVTRQSMILLDTAVSNSQVPQYEHWLCLHLSAPLPDGSAISVIHSTLAYIDYQTTVNFISTPSEALKANVFGIAPNEPKELKIAAWLPGFGDDGVVTFTEKYAYIIDADTEEIVSRAYPIERKVAYDAPNDASLLVPGSPFIASTTRWTNIQSISKADPMVMEVDDASYFTVDEPCGAAYVTGMNEVNLFTGSDILTPTAADTGSSPNTVTFGDVDSTSFTTYTGEGKLFARNPYYANGSGTNIYRVVANNWTPPKLNGNYRWYVPNLGVSPETFTADYSIHYTAARLHYGTAYMNHMNGIAKDGRYGYTAPRNFYYGENGWTWRRTRQPLAANVNNGGTLSEATIGADPWKTTTLFPQPLTGFQDAGDYDTRMQYRDLIPMLLQRHILSTEAWEADYGYPTALSLGIDATFWAGTESLPNIYQGFIVHFEHMRLMRESTGECSGGYNFGADQEGNPSAFGPSYLTPFQIQGYVYAPDQQSTWEYSMVAAELGRVLKLDGMTTLGNTLIAQAEVSYARGQEIVDDPTTFYADFIDADGGTAYAANSSNLTSTGSRDLAAIWLYAATGDTDYLATAEAGSAMNPSSTSSLKRLNRMAAFAYEMIGEDPNKNLDFAAEIASVGESALAAIARSPYASSAYTGNPQYSLWAPCHDADRLWIAYGVTGDKRYINAMSEICNHLYGANFHGKSWCRELGARYFRGQTNIDTEQRGEEAPAGSFPYGYNRWNLEGVNESVFLFGHGQSGNQYVKLFMYPNQGSVPHKAVEPPPQFQPILNWRTEERNIIGLMEHGPQDNLQMFPLHAIIWDYHGHGSTTQGAYTRNIGQWAA